MTDLFLASILGMMLIIGMRFPVVAVCCYLWVDLVKPMTLSYGFLSSVPMSMLAALVVVASYTLNFKKLAFPKNYSISVLLIVLAFWVTITTLNAYAPALAWIKWDWAFKTILFTILMPFALKTRKDIEIFILIFICCMSFYVMTVGFKTLLGSGFYGANYFVNTSNSGLYESSTLALAAVLTIPLLIFISKHSILLPKSKLIKLTLFGVGVLCVLSVIGTYARTGMIGLLFLVGIYILTSKRKILYSISATLVLFTALMTVPDTWQARMSTVSEAETDSSALGRIVVWKWTIDHTSKHPMGAGFVGYLANKGELDDYHDLSGVSYNHKAKAYHNIFIEMLGEHGYFGLFIYLAIILSALNLLRKLKTSSRQWIRDLSSAIKINIYCYCICGQFIGIAFQPLIYILLILTIAVYTIEYRLENIEYRSSENEKATI